MGISKIEIILPIYCSTYIFACFVYFSVYKISLNSFVVHHSVSGWISLTMGQRLGGKLSPFAHIACKPYSSGVQSALRMGNLKQGMKTTQ